MSISDKKADKVIELSNFIDHDDKLAKIYFEKIIARVRRVRNRG